VGRLLTQPRTFSEHATGYFYCWCVPYHEFKRGEDGEWALVITHNAPNDA
jgi:hypothetical protein